MVSTTLSRWGGPAAIAGGVLWVVLRALIEFSRDTVVLGYTYEDYNRLVPIPLLLFLLALVGLRGRCAPVVRLLGTAGLVLAAAGVIVAAAGVVIEFWWAGGIRQGDKVGSDAGWMLFGLGYFGLLAGLMLFGVAAQRSDALGRWSALPLALGVIGLLWPFLAEVWIVLNVLIQVLFGLGWITLGYVLWARNREQHATGGGSPVERT